MQENLFDFLRKVDRLEEFISNTNNDSALNDYLVCPKCGEKLIKEIDKHKYHCYKCNKDYYQNNNKEKGPE